jgi:hypothetical protein
VKNETTVLVCRYSDKYSDKRKKKVLEKRGGLKSASVIEKYQLGGHVKKSTRG